MRKSIQLAVIILGLSGTPLLGLSAGENNAVLNQINQALNQPQKGSASKNVSNAAEKPSEDPSAKAFREQYRQANPQTRVAANARQGHPVGPPASKQALRDAAFNALVQHQMPLSPQQIIELRHFYTESQRAAATPAGVPPKPVATSLLVNLSPGSSPPAIRLAAGFVSSLVFLDATGAPWPIQSYDLGDPKSFNIQWDHKSNTLMIQAATLYTYGNLAIKLQGLSTPVMLTLIPGQKVVDYRIDLRVQGIGPNASSLPTGDGLPSSATDLLLGVLDGVPPQSSKTLHVSGGKASAWMENNKIYMRTRYNILSPGWLAKMSSADGMNAYQLLKTPMVLVSAHGKVMQLKLEGF